MNCSPGAPGTPEHTTALPRNRMCPLLTLLSSPLLQLVDEVQGSQFIVVTTDLPLNHSPLPLRGKHMNRGDRGGIQYEAFLNIYIKAEQSSIHTNETVASAASVA